MHQYFYRAAHVFKPCTAPERNWKDFYMSVNFSINKISFVEFRSVIKFFVEKGLSVKEVQSKVESVNRSDGPN